MVCNSHSYGGTRVIKAFKCECIKHNKIWENAIFVFQKAKFNGEEHPIKLNFRVFASKEDYLTGDQLDSVNYTLDSEADRKAVGDFFFALLEKNGHIDPARYFELQTGEEYAIEKKALLKKALLEKAKLEKENEEE